MEANKQTAEQSAEQSAYATLCKQVASTIDGSIKLENKWVSTGEQVRKVFGSESALMEVKAQFIADAIVPGLSQVQRAALTRTLLSKRSKEYKQLSEHDKLIHGAQVQAQKDARAIAHTYFARVCKYAFPKGESESNGQTATTRTKIADLILDAIKKGEKDESPDYDVVNLLDYLKRALAIVANNED